MLNTFPQLLYPFIAPLILRVAVALVFFYIAYKQHNRREQISALGLPGGQMFVWLAAIFHTLVGAAFLFGFYTQVAAILAIVGLLIGWWLNRRYPSVVILPNSTILILVVVCASLIISGAGAFARDLPL